MVKFNIIRKNTIEINGELFTVPKEDYKKSTKRYISKTGDLHYINDKEIKKAKNRDRRSVKKYKDDIAEIGEDIVKFFNSEDNTLIIPYNRYIIKNVIKKVNEERGDNKILLKVADQFYAINDRTIRRLENEMKDNLFGVDSHYSGSDSEIIMNLRQHDTIEIQKVDDLARSAKVWRQEKQKGMFFKYLNLTKFDLDRYGIHKTIDNANYHDNCLIIAFKNGGMSEIKLDDARRIIKSREVAKLMLKEISEKLQIKIILSHVKDNVRQEIYGKNYEEVYRIGLYDEHYFINDEVKINSYCLENYEDVKDERECHKIYKKRDGIFRREERYIDSLKLFKILIEHKDKLLKPITINDKETASTIFYEKMDKNELTSLEIREEDFRPIVYKGDREDKDDFENIFFDFETDSTKKHTPYLCRIWNKHTGLNKSFEGKECGFKMLCSLKKNTRLIAHNATYDFRFIIKYLGGVSECSKGNHLYKATGYFNRHKIEVKDSLNLINAPLRNFPKMFKMKNMIKEVMPYKIYTQENINKRFIKIEEAVKELKKDEVNQFLENIEKWNLRKGDEYDIINYSSEYCRLDCEILQDGYEMFRSWIQEYLDLDINNILTIASLADKYMIKNGCYEGCYSLAGNSQIFIQKTVVGGRVMCANNEKARHTKIMNDFDAVSLYPSAMVRIEGFLKGKPKILVDKNYDNIKNYDHYFIRIKINENGVNRAFPLMSKKSEDKNRRFSNDMIGETIYVDKTTLEDLIEHHKIKFEIIDGYYFDEGFNTTIRDKIKYLFEKRKELKKQKNPAELIFKLIMNSSYGKTIMKETLTESFFIRGEEKKNSFIRNNYYKMKDMINIDNSDLYKITCFKDLNRHENRPHIGSMILSMSKRIMNEVMCTAEDNNINIYYQDTDSMHLENKNIEKLSKVFKNKYNRELIGEELGQFHSDFSVADCDEVLAIKSIFLGKKSYIDELIGYNKTTGKMKISHHIRLKGIPNSCIKYTANKMDISVMELYEHLYRGDNISFDLTEGNNKTNFEFKKDYSVETKTEFDRELSF